MALSAARELFDSRRGPITARGLMAASTTIYKGGYVMANANGLWVPAAIAAGNHGVVGIALETVTSLASGSYYCPVQYGEVYIPAAAVTSIAQARVGEWAYADDDETIDVQGAAAVNSPAIGQIMQQDGGVWLNIDPALNFLNGPHP